MAAPEFECYSKQEVNYHIGLCYEAGFLHVHRDTSLGSVIAIYQIRNLTWEGHLELEEEKYACRD